MSTTTDLVTVLKKELKAALRSPDAAYKHFKARFRPPPPGERIAWTLASREIDAQRKAVFLKNLAHSAAENAKGTNTCASDSVPPAMWVSGIWESP